MTEQFANGIQSQLTATLSSGATSAVIQSAIGFPATGNFRCLISQINNGVVSNEEVVTVTARAGTTLTIARASEPYGGSQVARDHDVGEFVTIVLTAASLELVQGPTGATGSSGAAGATGATGSTGAVGTDGSTILNGVVAPTSEDGAEDDFYINTDTNEIYGPKVGSSWGSPTPYVGPPGDPGPTGAQGPIGPSVLTFLGDWNSGTAYVQNDWVVDGANSYVALDSNTNQQPSLSPAHWSILNIAGPAGPTGATGADGDPGDPGAPGIDGADGATGATGAVGATGSTGAQGNAGPTGATGATGTAGTSGATGPQGIQGVTGAQGQQGDVGPAILTFQGDWDSGTTYDANDWVSFGGTGYWALVGSNLNHQPDISPSFWSLLTISGPQGPQGIQGPQGVVGVTGAQGAAGATGSVGTAGPTGATGATGTGSAGATGATGAAGAAGPAGAGALTGRLAAAMTSGATSMTVNVNGEWPIIPTDLGSFNVLIDNELITVQATNSGTTPRTMSSLLRARFGTSATAHNKNAVVALRALIGPTGPAGATGSTGNVGATGSAGATGSTGATGATGSVGPTGSTGATGAGATHAIEFVIDGGGTVIATGVKGDLEIPIASTITGWKLLADQSGSIVVNVWKDTYANFPPTVADKITASAPPTISSATKNSDTTLTGWTTAISAGDILRFNVDSVTTITRVTLVLAITV